MPSLQLIQIEKLYKKAIKDASPQFTLHPVNLTIEDGEFFALLGPSGCGKTTLLKLIAGLLPADRGDLIVGSEKISELSADKRGFSMVFQQPLLFPHMTVLENVAFGLKMQGVGRHERLQKAEQILEDVGLTGYGPRYPSALSGGQQQRVSLARAIVTNPKLLLMDEPFSALDPSLREEMRDLLKRIHRQYNTTIVFVTHDREEAFLLADRMAVMMQGKILQVGNPKEIYETPESSEVALFLGVKNVWEGEVIEGYFISNHLKIRLDPGKYFDGKKLGWFMIRPESFYLSNGFGDYETEVAGNGYMRTLEGILQEMSFRQGLYHMKLAISGLTVEMVDKTGTHLPPQIEDSVSIWFDIRQTHFIPYD